MDNLTTLLDSYNANILHEMAQAAGLDTTRDGKKKLRKKELMVKLRREYFTKERVLASLERLSEQDRAVLDRLILRGDTVPTRSLRRELIRAGLATEAPEPERKEYVYWLSYAGGYIGQPHPAGSTVFEDIIARLTYHGLVFSQGADANATGAAYKLQYHPAATLFIPPEIRPYLPDPDPLEARQTERQPVRVYAGTPDLFLRDLYLYWDFVRQNEVSLLKTGYVAKRMLKSINSILLSSDPRLGEARREDDAGHIYLLRQLLEKLGLLRLSGNRLHLTSKNPLHIPDFWSEPVVKQVSRCLDAWPSLTGFKELSSDAVTYGAHFPTARRAVLKALKTLPDEIWLPPDELLEQIQIENVDFLLPEHSRVEDQRLGGYYYSRYSRPSFYGKPADLLAIFERLETDFIKACLGDFLYRLGVVELGGATESEAQNSSEGQPKTWDAFRLTPLGRAVLGKPVTLSDKPVHTGKVVIQPNFQMMAIGPVALNVLARLDLFAHREQVDRGVFQYRLSKESVYQAQQLGWPASEIIEFLKQTAETDLPQNIRRSLEEWAGHHERIVFRTGVSLLQTANAGLLQQLLTESPAAKHLARPVAADVALIKNKQQQSLAAALIEQGLLPAISGADPSAADQSVMIQADGLIQPVHAVPSLHLRGRLAQIAAETEDGWRLTADSIRRSGGGRNEVNRLLDELKKLHRGRLPESLVARLKAWGGYYGQAAAETLTLIEFNDPAAWQELSQQPALQADLTPFSAGDRALAVVPTDRLAEIKEILAGFGVQVKEGLSTSF